ncbi:MAG TPA: hypothetical protein PKA53_04995 [Sphingobacterium sp.]|nr:hypothetical protein [Sphingobacterium sp.]
MDADFQAFLMHFGKDLSFTDYLSYKFYPKVFTEYLESYRKYGDVSVVPTPYFLYGMKPGEKTTVELVRGKTLLVRLMSIGPPDADGCRIVFFKLNGQTRNLEIRDVSSKVERKENRKTDPADEGQVGSPLQGMLCELCVSVGDTVSMNQALFVIEAMKMESTVTSSVEGTVKHIELQAGTLVKTDDLVVIIE